MSDMEKVLDLLTGMNSRMDTMQEDIESLREEVETLKRTSATKEDLQQTQRDMMALMEGYFTPKFNLLFDQIKLTQEKQAPMEVLERTEDRLDVLEAVVKSHSADIAKLKKAQ